MAHDSPPPIGPEDLLSLAREMSDAAAEMRAIRTQSSVVINAGGITNAVAVCVSLCAVVLFVVFASAMVWLYAQERGTREAWSEVYSRDQAQMRAEWNVIKREAANAGK